MAAQLRTATSPPSWTARLVAAARLAALLYALVVAGLLLTTVGPALTVQWRPLAVVSGSMQPAIPPGAVVLVEPATPGRTYEHPAVVAYPDPARPDRLVTHRVVAAAADDAGAVSYTTRGDANRASDSARVPHDTVVGHVRVTVPFLGLPALWLRRGDLPALAAWALTSLLAAAVLVRQRPS